ncbi:LuxR C-terminal-related transcriptional regulator [Armatimonas rosea]|uniref:DNA-binding NarL/FixJ family response regulator n=1 Tax=Armatimonas rosea TaxID=685828 RepID=A0A7W9W5J6_ARMRO|nr:response regulator transcription factor [Armatimonas rosea]MBB6049638.1 DNA-binding NarL/FixJ family response regulator [Armatimonas rosea]
MKKICTLIVAPYAPVRAGLAALLRETEAICVQGELPSNTETLARMLPGLTPDAILYDGDGLEALLATIERMPEPPALVVLGEQPNRDLPLLQAAEALPGWGYLSRDSEAHTLMLALQSAAAGLVVQEAQAHTTPAPVDDVLTHRELEVLALMAQGLPNKLIAHKLGVTLHTAKFHVAQILAKLGAASRTEAVTLGARRGLIAL